jgi:hypothetical protein
MDPITIGAFLLSAGSSIAGGFLGNKAAKTQAAAANASYRQEILASSTRNIAINVQKQASVRGSQLEWKAGSLDFEAALLQGEAAIAQASADLFNTLIDSENVGRQFDAEAQADEFSAKVAMQMSRNAKDVAMSEARDFKLKAGLQVESQAALQAGSGFMLQGSPLLVQDVLLGEVELGANRLKLAGEVERNRLEQQAEQLVYSGKLNKQSALIARETGKINAQYVKETGKIRLDAAFLAGDASLLKQEGSRINMDTAIMTAEYSTLANKQALKASKIQAQATAKGAQIQGQAAMVQGFGNAFGTIASSGMFG